MEIKTCSKCEGEKLLKAFHKDAQAKSGRQSVCKECRSKYMQKPEIKKQQRSYRGTAEHKERMREYNRTYKATPKYKTYLKKYKKRDEVLIRIKANSAINSALVAGNITRPNSCSSCATECTPDGHHPDYSKPLDVIWLCRTCHTKAHL